LPSSRPAASTIYAQPPLPWCANPQSHFTTGVSLQAKLARNNGYRPEVRRSNSLGRAARVMSVICGGGEFTLSQATRPHPHSGGIAPAVRNSTSFANTLHYRSSIASQRPSNASSLVVRHHQAELASERLYGRVSSQFSRSIAGLIRGELITDTTSATWQ
jgi:hypothetical protein